MSAEVVKLEPRIASLDDMRAFAEVAVKSRFYGFDNPDQMLPLMIIAQSEGRSFASVVQEYSVIQNRPALKAEAMLARFQRAGGHIRWTELSDKRCAAVFSHPQCDPVEIDWDMDRAHKAGLANRGPWKSYPRSMLKARVISDGVRTAFPACLGGLYTPEEVGDFEPASASPPTPNGRGALAAPSNAGLHEPYSEPPLSPTDSNVPGGVRSVKDFPQEEALTETDYTTDPEWATLSTHLRGNCESRSDVLEWWEARKADLKKRRPHFAKAFHMNAIIPFAASFEVEQVWEDEVGARG